MQNKGFSLDDPLWVTVSKAQEGMMQLMTELRCGDYRTRRPLPKRHSQPQHDRNERRGDKERAEAKAQGPRYPRCSCTRAGFEDKKPMRQANAP